MMGEKESKDDLLREIQALGQKKQQLLSEVRSLQGLTNRKPAIKLSPNMYVLNNGKTQEPKPRRPKKIILKHFLSPGDILMLTAAVRDLHRAYPRQFLTDVRTTSMELWENNPFITKLNENDPDVVKLDCNYDLIHRSNQQPYHFIHGYHLDLEKHFGLRIPVTEFKGDIYLSEKERYSPSPAEKFGVKGDYWIIVAGGKYDYTTKWWNPDSYQQVVDHFKGKITFVQCGKNHKWPPPLTKQEVEDVHFHPKLNGVVDMIGQTPSREFIRLMYHASGVLCPITFAMHAAAAVPLKPYMKHRACVVIAGGREAVHWEEYPGHRYLAVNGTMDCCATGGCWVSRCQPAGDGDGKDNSLCKYPVKVWDNLSIPKCMNMIKPDDVIRAISLYYEGGLLKYES